MLPCRHTQCKHSLTHKFIRYTLIVLHWTLFFPLRTSLILHGADSTTCWKPCSEMLVHVNMTVSFSCYIYISSTISQRCSVGLRSRDGVFFFKVSLAQPSEDEYTWSKMDDHSQQQCSGRLWHLLWCAASKVDKQCIQR